MSSWWELSVWRGSERRDQHSDGIDWWVSPHVCDAEIGSVNSNRSTDICCVDWVPGTLHRMFHLFPMMTLWSDIPLLRREDLKSERWSYWLKASPVSKWWHLELNLSSLIQRPCFSLLHLLYCFLTERLRLGARRERETHRDSNEATGLWAGLVFSSGRMLGPGEIPKAHRYLGNAVQAWS